MTATPRASAPDGSNTTGEQKPANDDRKPTSDTIPDWVFELNQTYEVVNEEGKVLVHRRWFDPSLGHHRNQWIGFDDFKRMHDNKSVRSGTDKDGNPTYKPKGTAWLKHRHRTQYDGVVFAPGKDVPHNVLNLWRGFTVSPKLGDWSKMRDHIHEVICGGNDEYAEYTLNWMARCVQQPAGPGGVALVWRGDEGLGKGIVARWLGKMFGEHFIHAQRPKDLVGQFNGDLETAALVFADEAMFAGDPGMNGILKALITEPTIPCENKYRNKKQVTNNVHLIFASNEKFVIRAGPHARRYFVLDVADTHRDDQDYFRAIDKQMEEGGLAAMLYDLQRRDISKFNHFKVPQTAALIDQKLHSLTGAEGWLFHCLQAGMIGHHDWTDHEACMVSTGAAYELPAVVRQEQGISAGE